MARELKITPWSRFGLIGLLVVSALLNAVFGWALLSGSLRSSRDLLHPGLTLVASSALSSAYRSGPQTNHSALLKRLNSRFGRLPSGSFSLYFETLNSGGWFGLREDEKMSPGSLRKTALIAATFKLAERGKLTFNRQVRIETRHLDLSLGLSRAVGPLAANGAGQVLSVKQLVEHIAKHSDNTATTALIELVGYDAYAEAMFAMGMSWKTWRENFENHQMSDYPASAYEFTQGFRSLYYSGYLAPQDSQEVLRLLSESIFQDGIPAGATGIAVAHKTGDWAEGDYHHDCGIVYFPGNPFTLCIMTRGLGNVAAQRLIAQISEEVVDYVRELSDGVVAPAQ